MPFYELALVLRPMPKKEVVDCLKRCANHIWNENGVVKKIEYLGEKNLPYKIPTQNEGEYYHQGQYFIFHVSLNATKWAKMKPEFRLDLDVLRTGGNLVDQSKVPDDYECTLDEEFKPPAFRKSVRPLLDDKNVRAEVRR